MLIALMYHRVGSQKHANPLEVFKEHLPFLKEHYPILLPGEAIKGLSLCLTFDDAHYDFYHYIFPLLVKYNIRAVLGVPVKYILDDTSTPAAERLSIHYSVAMQQFEKAPFCTWKELLTMHQSGLVDIASHSFSHDNLLEAQDLDLEIKYSKEVIKERLNHNVSTFIYPYGQCNALIQKKVSKSYQYSFRIGSALNRGWNHSPLCRLRGDQLQTPYFPKKRDLILPYIKNLIQFNSFN